MRRGNVIEREAFFQREAMRRPLAFAVEAPTATGVPWLDLAGVALALFAMALAAVPGGGC